MSTDRIITVYHSSPNFTAKIETDNESITDNKLKTKLRDINLIKYNPTLFTNRGEFLEVLGGEKSLCLILGLAGLFYVYRVKVNPTRGIKPGHGVAYNLIYAGLGGLIGGFYSFLYTVPQQRLLNDYIAQYLFKRYPESKKIVRTNLWKYNNIPNDDSAYYYTSKYGQTFHF